MSIISSELKRYKAQVNDDTASNGGRMSAVESVSGVANNVWPNVSQAERTAGATKYRKLFHKVDNAGDLALVNAKVFLERPTPADDRVYLFPGTQADVQNDITGSENLYGAGALDVSVSAGATSIDVLVEDGATAVFRDTETIRISDKPDVDSEGSEEFVTISGTPGVAGDVITITLATPLQNSYSNVDTVVSSVIEPSDIAGAYSNVIETTASGTLDEAQTVVHSIGGVQQDWTITFTSATAFDVVGDTVGSVGSGNISSDFSPTNTDFGTPYFTLPSAAWGGTWASGDTVTFTSSPASVPVWEKRVVPAGADSLAGNQRIIVLSGESA